LLDQVQALKRALRVTQRTWQGSGSTYSLWWGGCRWTLSLNQDRPGLRTAENPAACVQSLEGLAVPGRSDFHAFTARSLVGVELSRSSVRATYAPPGWAGLQVRASWTPVANRDGIDLEIQVLTSSVGELNSVEIHVATRLLEPESDAIGTSPLASWVTPRDARSGSLSYDGRETRGVLRLLTTLPVPSADEVGFPPISLTPPWPDRSSCYIEMVHPHDVSRRIVQSRSRDLHCPGSVRYGFFGHDLEKGVILRGRLRGLWIISDSRSESVSEAYREFLELPPPLGT
jgi:hypothetical protein